MRHQKKGFKLGRTQSHRKATLAALSNALIEHKRITTTLTKAKALRMYVEPLINRAKEDTTHNRRQVFRHLQKKASIKTLFDEVSEKIVDRPGGYTRIVKLGQRAGDSAEMAVIELVDYNDVKPEGTTTSRRRTRRGQRRGGSATKPAAAAVAAVKEVEVEDAVEVEAAAEIEATVVDEAEAVEETVEAEEIATEVVAEAEEAASDDEATDDEEKKEG